MTDPPEFGSLISHQGGVQGFAARQTWAGSQRTDKPAGWPTIRADGEELTTANFESESYWEYHIEISSSMMLRDGSRWPLITIEALRRILDPTAVRRVSLPALIILLSTPLFTPRFADERPPLPPRLGARFGEHLRRTRHRQVRPDASVRNRDRIGYNTLA
jgi:hypothetical protein